MCRCYLSQGKIWIFHQGRSMQDGRAICQATILSHLLAALVCPEIASIGKPMAPPSTSREIMEARQGPILVAFLLACLPTIGVCADEPAAVVRPLNYAAAPSLRGTAIQPPYRSRSMLRPQYRSQRTTFQRLAVIRQRLFNP